MPILGAQNTLSCNFRSTKPFNSFRSPLSIRDDCSSNLNFFLCLRAVAQWWSPKEQQQHPWELVRNSHSPPHTYWVRSLGGGDQDSVFYWNLQVLEAFCYKQKFENHCLESHDLIGKYLTPTVFWATELPAWFLTGPPIPSLEWEAHLFTCLFSRVLMSSGVLVNPSCPRT